MVWKCQLLLRTDGRQTQVGVTEDLDRRLAQHNGLKSGGARATHGKEWKRVCHVEGFPDHRAVLQFEWAWKHETRKEAKGEPLQRRMAALQRLLSYEKPTRAAVPQAEYIVPPEVIWDDSEVEIPPLS